MAKRDLFHSPPPPWNARRIIGPKPPFKAKHVWAIRQQLKANGRVRDLARSAAEHASQIAAQNRETLADIKDELDDLSHR